MINIENDSKTSFWQLITKAEIEIPIIQRDYAQGRNDSKTQKIRNRFLDVLFNAITNEHEAQELDFVYGKLEEGVLQPLDGQQRLTTLFLLHWYIAKEENKFDTAKQNLLKFTYKTRTSSSDFCKSLVENVNNIGLGKTISEQIKDSSWFFLSWIKDPTIKAILVMLDAIEAKHKQINSVNKDNLWERLISETALPITFQYLELKDFGLSDDLYIKMNARGKHLTDFEYFKARFEKKIIDSKWEEENKNDQSKTFSHKVDTVWTDLFWKHRNDNNKIDEAFIKFIAGIAINLYAQNQEIYSDEEENSSIKKELETENKNKSISEEAIKKERIERRIRKLFNSPNDVDPKDFIAKDDFEYLIKCIDIYSLKEIRYDSLLPNNLPLWDYCKDSSLFKEFIKTKETTYSQRILFYAQTEYLLANEILDKDLFSCWMRVIRNIVQNSTIDNSTAFISALNLIKELSIGSNNIYEYLKDNLVASGFSSNQVKEEILKAKIITKDNMQVIFDTEDINFCKGQIRFALYCIDLEKSEDIFDVEKLMDVQSVMKLHLNHFDITNNFRRALLTIGNNDFYNYWWSWSYGTETNKRCLIENTSVLKSYFANGDRKADLKVLINKLIDQSPEEIASNFICPDDMVNWKKRLIKEPGLLDEHCQSHYMGITPDNTCCYLYYHRKRPSSKEECKRVH